MNYENSYITVCTRIAIYQMRFSTIKRVQNIRSLKNKWIIDATNSPMKLIK